MFFTIKNEDKSSIDLIRSEIKFNARKRILMYRMAANEIIIEQYLQKEYKTNLKEFCLKLIKYISILSNNNDEIIIKIINKDYDKLAQLVTYGNGQFHGSKILQYAFDL